MAIEINNISLFLSNRCNLDCAYCGVDKKHTARLAVPQIKTFIQWFVKQPTSSDTRGMSITGGEPFLEFESIKTAVTFFKKNNTDKKSFIHTIPTNGTVITNDICNFIKSEGLKVAISLDGDKTTNAPRYFKNGGSTFDIVWRNMERFTRFMGHPPRINMTVTPHNVKDLYTNVAFLVENGYYVLNPNIALFTVKWTQKAIDIFLSELKKICELCLRRKVAGKPIDIYSISEIWEKEGNGIDKDMFHCGFGNKLSLFSDGNIYNCEVPTTGYKKWKARFKVGRVQRKNVVIDMKKIEKICHFDIYKEFGVKARDPFISSFFKKYACLACDMNGRFLRKSYIQNALDIRIKKIALILKFSEGVKKEIETHSHEN